MRRVGLATAALGALLGAAAHAGNLFVPLVIDETDGIARTASPVTAGVPLPQGRLDPRLLFQLRVIDLAGGAAIPAQLESEAAWPDGSVRWLLCDFLADVPAGGTARYAVTQDPVLPQPAQVMTYSERVDAWFMDSPVASWGCIYRGFQPFTAAFDSARGQHVGPLGAELRLRQGSTVFTSVSDSTSVLAVEARGPVRATVRADGRIGDVLAPLFYECRMHAYGNGLMRIFVTLRNPYPAAHPNNVWDLGAGGGQDITDFAIEVPLLMSGPVTWRTWTAPGAMDTGTMGTSVALYQESSGGARWDWPTHVNRNDVVPLTFRGWQLRVDGATARSGDRADAMIDVSDAGGGIAAGIRHSWQNFPNALRATPSSLSIAMIPDEFPEDVELQGGEQKTWELALVAHSGWTPAQVEAAMLDALHPLRARPEAESARRSLALGRYGPRPATPGAWDETVSYIAFDRGVRSFFTQREEIDEYGWRDFGEVFADHETDCGTQCWDCPVSHDNDQYDYIAAEQLMWLRDGEREWADLGEQGARHLMDVDVYHTGGDTPAYDHGLFWHTTHDTNAYTSTHRTYSALMSSACTPYLSGGPALGHLYTEGLLLHGMLTGDRAALDVLAELEQYAATRYALDAPGSGTGYEVRAWANALRAAVAGWRRAGDPAMLQLARQVVTDCNPLLNPTMDGTTFGDSMLMVSLGRWLDLLDDMGLATGADAVAARAALKELARRVRDNHAPQQDVLDFRSSEGLWSAYRHADPSDPERATWAALGRAYYEAGERTAWFRTYITAKGLAHVATNGHLHQYFDAGRFPAEATRLMVRRAGGDVALSWDPVSADIDGDPIVVASHRVYESRGRATLFSDASVASSGAGAPTHVATGEAGNGVALTCYEVRAVSSQGIEGQ